MLLDKYKERPRAQMRAVARYLNKTLHLYDITYINLIDKLDNGVVLIKLARHIQKAAETYWRYRYYKPRLPTVNLHCWEYAKPGSFYARDNIANFIEWCQQFGVHEVLLFETDDLIHHREIRSILLCLLEVARLASRYGVIPPESIAEFEDLEEYFSADSDFESWSKTPSPILKKSASSLESIPFHIKSPPRSPEPDAIQTIKSKLSSLPTRTRTPDPVTIERIKTPEPKSPTLKRSGSFTSSGTLSSPQIISRLPYRSSTPPITRRKVSDLDRKVFEIANNVLNAPSVTRIYEGRYCVGGKSFSARLVPNNRVMVRVGGGWDTLEHFLLNSVRPYDITHRYLELKDLEWYKRYRDGPLYLRRPCSTAGYSKLFGSGKFYI